jgi:hypothetical protein
VVTVSDVVLILGAVGALVTVITAAVVSLRKIDTVKKELREDVQAVHKIVNQQRTDMLAYQKTLIDVLVSKGIHVPTDSSLLKE